MKLNIEKIERTKKINLFWEEVLILLGEINGKNLLRCL